MFFKLLHKSKKTGKATVFICYRFEGKEMVKSTGVSVLPQHFNTKTGKVSKADPEAHEKQPQITALKQQLEAYVDIVVKEGYKPTAKGLASFYEEKQLQEKQKEALLDEAYDLFLTESQRLEKEIVELEAKLARKKEMLRRMLYTLDLNTGTSFVECIGTYQRVNPKNRKASTIKALTTLSLLVKDFNPLLSLEEINLNTFTSFQDFLIHKKKLRNRTIRVAIARFKKVLKHFAKEKGLNLDYLTDFEVVKDLGNDNIIYLTQEELQEITEIEPTTLTRRQRQVQQQFLFAAETGLRHSDVLNVGFGNVQNGHLVVTMQKVEKTVKVPLSEKAKAIMASPYFPFQAIDTSHYDKVIKAISKRLESFQQPVTLTHYVGNVATHETRQKWEVMSSHVARKTAINYWLSKGVAESVVVRWAGHKNAKMLHDHYQHRQAASDREALKLLA